jgi:DNA gyrase subunit A
VLTAKLTTKKGGLAGALIVRQHQELVFISQNGMVQRTSVSGISRMGRPTQGVKVMNLKSDDQVSAVALVVESDESEAAEPPTDGAAPVGAGEEAAASGDGKPAKRASASKRSKPVRRSRRR